MPRHLIDLHCHTKEHSYDGEVPAAEFLAEAVARGYQGIVFTDHAYQWPDEELAELRDRARLPEGFFLASGQEVRTNLNGVTVGDLLVYGLKESLPDGTSPLDIFRMLTEVGGFAIAPHPAIPRIGLKEKLGDYPVLAGEVWNGRYGPEISEKCRKLVEAQGLVAVGGSDSHRPRDIGGGGTLFSRVPTSLADLRAMIAQGDCEPWHPPYDLSLKERVMQKWREFRKG